MVTHLLQWVVSWHLTKQWADIPWLETLTPDTSFQSIFDVISKFKVFPSSCILSHACCVKFELVKTFISCGLALWLEPGQLKSPQIRNRRPDAAIARPEGR